MLKVGSIILSIWSGANFLLASVILATVVLFKKNAPMLYIVFEESEIPALNPKVISATKSLAIQFNSSIAAFSLLALFVVWTGLINGQKWAFWALAISIGVAQIFSYFADAAIGNKTLIVNIVLTALYVVGISLAGYVVFGR